MYIDHTNNNNDDDVDDDDDDDDVTFTRWPRLLSELILTCLDNDQPEDDSISRLRCKSRSICKRWIKCVYKIKSNQINSVRNDHISLISNII